MHADPEVDLRRTIEGLIGVPATEGNQIDVLRNGIEVFPAMLEAIDGAQHSIDFLTFVYWKGRIGAEFAEHLAARARGRAGASAAGRIRVQAHRPRNSWG